MRSCLWMVRLDFDSTSKPLIYIQQYEHKKEPVPFEDGNVIHTTMKDSELPAAQVIAHAVPTISEMLSEKQLPMELQQ